MTTFELMRTWLILNIWMFLSYFSCPSYSIASGSRQEAKRKMILKYPGLVSHGWLRFLGTKKCIM